MTETTLQIISKTEKNVQRKLEAIQTEKKSLEQLTEEIMDNAGESVYHLNQVFHLDISAQDYSRATELLEEMQGYIRGVELELDDRRGDLVSQERKLTDQLDELHYQKKLNFSVRKELSRKESGDGQS